MDFAKGWVSGSVKCREMLDQLMTYDWLFNNWLAGDWFRYVMFADRVQRCKLIHLV